MGEGILFGNNTKTVAANALSDTAEVIALTEADIRKLEFSDPKEAINFYKHILLKQTNERLLDTGKELADIYELTNKLTELAKDGEK
jgi:CRP-like cAMP-binding protein